MEDLFQPVDDCTGQGSDGMAAASIWGWTKLHTALCWCCITQHVDQVSWGLVVLCFMGTAPGITPKAHSSQRGANPSPEPAAVGATVCTAQAGVWQQGTSSLNRPAWRESTEVTPYLGFNLTAGCKGWQTVPGASLGQIALQEHHHCHCHCHCCH